MHPPFFVVDHKVGPHKPVAYGPRPHVRRTTPQPLRFDLPTAASPHSTFAKPPLAAKEVAQTLAQPQGGLGGWLARLWRSPNRAHA